MDTERAYENDRATVPCNCKNAIPVEEFTNVRKDLVPTRGTAVTSVTNEGFNWGNFEG